MTDQTHVRYTCLALVNAVRICSPDCSLVERLWCISICTGQVRLSVCIPYLSASTLRSESVRIARKTYRCQYDLSSRSSSSSLETSMRAWRAEVIGTIATVCRLVVTLNHPGQLCTATEDVE